MKSKKYNFETQAIRTQSEQTQYREHSTPLFLTSSFTFENAQQGSAIFSGVEAGNLYSRFSNPNTSEFIKKLCLLENCPDGVSTASGMAAIYTSFAALLKSGDHILASKDIFGNALYIITQILPRMGVEYTLVNVDDKSAWKNNVQKNTKILYLETPSNPTLKIADLEYLSKLSKKHNIISIVDNCFATPYLQRPADYGIDLILHSATKYIDGQGRVLGGAILGRKDLIDKCFEFLRRTGACLSPFNAWILSKSLETLAIRMDRHCSNAHQIALWLKDATGIQSVSYPFLKSHPQHTLASAQMKLGGGLVAFELNGNRSDAMNFINRLKLFSLTANLGDARSIATHPASTTHAKLTPEQQLEAGITPAYIRLSVGLENVQDLIKDLDQAINF
jgi:O-succinylhomoserine sulfhydrylase